MLPHCSHLTHHPGDRRPAAHHGLELGLLLQTEVHPVDGVRSGPHPAVVPHDVLPGHHGQALAGQRPTVGPDTRHPDVGQPLLVLPLDPGEVGLVGGGVQAGPGEVVERGRPVDSVGERSSTRAPGLPVEGGGGWFY